MSETKQPPPYSPAEIEAAESTLLTAAIAHGDSECFRACQVVFDSLKFYSEAAVELHRRLTA